MKRFLYLILFLALVLAGCAPIVTPTPMTALPLAVTSEPCTLNVFAAANPGVTVTFNSIH